MISKLPFCLSTLLFASIFFTKVHAQSLSFLHTFESSPNLDIPGEIVVSGSGDLFITGTFEHDSLVIGNLVLHSPVQNRVNTFVAKLDTAGQCYWAQVVFHDTVYSNAPALALDSNDNVYITGFFSEQTDIDPGPNVQNVIPAAGYRSILLVKYDANGVFNWGFQVTDSTEFPTSTYVAIDENQDVVLSGTFSSLTDFDPSPVNNFFLQASVEVTREAFVAKYTPGGQFIRAFRLEEQNYGMAEIHDITTDSHNNILLTGYIVGSVDMDPDPVATHILTTNGSWDYFLTKYDPQGNLLWTFSVGSWTNEVGNFVYTDETDSIFVGGFMRSPSTDFDHSPTNAVMLTTHGESDVFFAKYSPDGDLALIKNIGGPGIELLTGMSRDPFDNFYWAISYWSNNWDCDFSNGVNTIAAIGGGDDLIMRTNSNGSVDFSFTIGTPFTDNYTRGIVPIDNGLFLYGWYNGGNADFDPSASVAYPAFYGMSDITLAKYFYKWDYHLDLNESPNSSDVLVYPNPVTTDILTIRNIPEGSTLSLCDLYGNTLISQESAGEAVLPDMNKLAAGVYLLTIESENGVFSVRLVVE